MHMHSARNASKNCGLLPVIGKTFTGNKAGTTMGKVNNNRRVYGTGRLQNGINSVRADNVDSRKRELPDDRPTRPLVGFVSVRSLIMSAL